MAIVKFGHASIPVSIGIKYITNPNKTDVKLISGKDCMPESAQSEMEFVQKLYTGSGTRSYYHMIQSFSPDDDLTLEEAHEIGVKMAKHCFPNNQVLVATHLDKNYLHNHFIINAVNLDASKMLNMTYQKGIAIKEYSNELCLQYGLTTTEVKSKCSNMPEWKKRLKYILEDALYSSTIMDDYINYLLRKGISVKYNEANKYMTYTDKEGHKCRDNKLFDERFLKENFEMYFDLGGNYSLIVEDYCNYQTPKAGNCTTGLAESLLEMIAALPNHTPNFDDGNYYFEDDELDKILQKMLAHGIKITKAQLYHARNDIYNAEQNQEQGFGLFM